MASQLRAKNRRDRTTTSETSRRLDQMGALLQAQQAQLEARLEQQQRLIERQQHEIEALSRRLQGDRPDAAAIEGRSRKRQGNGSRRDLLKMTGAAIAGAAGAAALGAQPALATQGQPVIAGQNNDETAATSLNADSGTGTDIDGLTARGSGQYSGLVGFGGNSGGGPGIVGYGGTPSAGIPGPGVKGIAGGGLGNPGPADARTGVFGYGISGMEASGIGVGLYAHGQNDTPGGADGILATGGASLDRDGSGIVVQGGGATGAQIRFIYGFIFGPPQAKPHTRGEVFMDQGQTVWVCVETGTGAAALWARVGAVNPSFFGGAQANTGGVMNLLPNPIRILDTRSGSPYAGGSTHAIQVTGASDLNGSTTKVPPGAVGVIGNVTAVFPQGAGDLRLFPHGAALPTTSNLNYVVNVTVANGCIVGLDSGGQVDIFADVGTTHVIFDASGFVI